MKVKDWLTKDRWIQGEFFQDKKGVSISIYNIECYQNPEIEKACLLGAVHYCYHPDMHHKIIDFISEEIDTLIQPWNDNPDRTWEDVYNLIERLDI